MSKFKEVTENTPQSSSEGNTGAKEQPSLQSANSGQIENSTPPTKMPLSGTSPESEGEMTTLTTVTTVEITEKIRQHAMLLKPLLSVLEKAGVVKRYKVLSADGKTIQRVRIEFDLAYWTQDLDLK